MWHAPDPTPALALLGRGSRLFGRGSKLSLAAVGIVAGIALAACNTQAKSNAPDSGDVVMPESPAATLGDADESGLVESPVATVAAPRPADVIYRSELMRATKNGRPAYLLAQLSPEPYRPRGSREGWLITRVFPSDPELCAPGCDLLEGDIILTVNGSPLERPEHLSALIAELETMQTLDVRLVRDQKLHQRKFMIVDQDPTG